jgi:hypothetical protein
MSRKTNIAAVGVADAYALVQEELDAALSAKDPEVAAAACRRAQLALARDKNSSTRRDRDAYTAPDRATAGVNRRGLIVLEGRSSIG